MPISFSLNAEVSTTTRANIRQGTPSTKAPILRRVDTGANLAVIGWCVGDEVAGNGHWWQLDQGSYIWSGACSSPVSSESQETALAQSPLATAGATPSALSAALKHGFETAFSLKLQKLLDECAASGHDFRIGQGIRTPQTQALYYCEWEGRTPFMIDQAADQLADQGATWLAGLLRKLRDVQRVAGWQTDQLPGSGWHQWGEAADCYCYRNGALVSDGNDPSYKFYADRARDLGLTPGFYFKRHQDSGHVQFRSQAGASDVFTWAMIDKTMQDRFGDKTALHYQ